MIGMLFGPSQVAARLCEFIFARNIHPLMMARFAVGMLVASFALLWLFGFSTPAAVLFAVMFGVANGLITIARGAVPLALFGAVGYGRIIGRIARPALIITAVAPVVIAVRRGTRVRSGRARRRGRVRGGCVRLLCADPPLARDRAERRESVARRGQAPTRARRASSSMRRTSASTESNFSSGLIQPMNATSIGAP